MKSFLFALFLCAYSISYAQKDPCSAIKKTVKELEGVTIYSTPTGSVILYKIIKNDQKQFYAYFLGIGKTSNYSARGLYIKFEDGTIIKNEEIEIDCTYIATDLYSYKGAFPITIDNEEIILTKKITKYSLSGIEGIIADKFASNLLSYANCMKDL